MIDRQRAEKITLPKIEVRRIFFVLVFIKKHTLDTHTQVQTHIHTLLLDGVSSATLTTPVTLTTSPGLLTLLYLSDKSMINCDCRKNLR